MSNENEELDNFVIIEYVLERLPSLNWDNTSEWLSDIENILYLSSYKVYVG